MKRPRPRDFFVCPHCGAELPIDARFCPECGSDEETGWPENGSGWEVGVQSGSDSSDEDFDYDEFVRKEFPEQAPKPAFHKRLWSTVVVLVVIAFVLWILAHG